MATQTAAMDGTDGEPRHSSLPLVMVASSLGTLIEWYDFYIFGSLTTVLAIKFYPPGNATFALIAYLATFGIGFAVRPFGALFFGRIGDVIGRKYTFLVTLTIMGGATFVIGLMPTFATAGWIAPVTLILIRTLQGLALGGEYGGAAVYVAEHVSDKTRGFYTSFVQITAGLGVVVSLLVILATQFSMSKEEFTNWGWRLPFLISLVLVGISFYIRMKLRESPVFAHIKATGKTSQEPLKEAFANWANLKQGLICLFGAAAGQGIVSYMGQFYALFYLQAILKVNPRTANIVVAVAITAAMPSVIIFGALSDKIGRKKIIMAGCLLAAITYVPIYQGMERAAGNNVVAVRSTRDKVTGAIALTPMTTNTTGELVAAKEAANPNNSKLILLVFLQAVYAGMVYGPIAAYLVEAFPARIRYTALSLPYHLGNGVFGGLLPLIGLSICAATGNIYAGLYYPVGVTALTFVVGSLALRETHGTRIWDEVENHSVVTSSGR
jgi:MFS family permease